MVVKVETQIYHLAQTASVQKMWQFDLQPTRHSWVFNLRMDLINEVINLLPDDQMVPAGNQVYATRYED